MSDCSGSAATPWLDDLSRPSRRAATLNPRVRRRGRRPIQIVKDTAAGLSVWSDGSERVNAGPGCVLDKGAATVINLRDGDDVFYDGTSTDVINGGPATSP